MQGVRAQQIATVLVQGVARLAAQAEGHRDVASGALLGAGLAHARVVDSGDGVEGARGHAGVTARVQEVVLLAEGAGGGRLTSAAVVAALHACRGGGVGAIRACHIALSIVEIGHGSQAAGALVREEGASGTLAGRAAPLSVGEQ